MARFHELTVTGVRKTIRDAVVVTLQPVNGAADAFDFTQGQYLTFRREFDGEELRRSYSICAGKDEGILQVGIKRVEDGRMSNYLNDLGAGGSIQVMTPDGRFMAPAGQAVDYLLIAAGSGITPMLSIADVLGVHQSDLIDFE